MNDREFIGAVFVAANLLAAIVGFGWVMYHSWKK